MKKRAPMNRTLRCSLQEMYDLSKEIMTINKHMTAKEIVNNIINQDIFEVAPRLPKNFVDVLILDPPYNLTKNYNGNIFSEKEECHYKKWFNSMIQIIKPCLKATSTIYICSDWKTSILIAPILSKNFNIQNRITWEREKGRGAKKNLKNNTEDIWFCTVSDRYIFNVEDVKLKRKVIAPYRTKDGNPKDWMEGKQGNFRLTYPSNIWTDISIPFWSMPENTDHPTQKPEKLIAKLILASSNSEDLVFDPFLGSGTTAVVAKKLRRKFVGVEINKEYCCWSLKRLRIAEKNPHIQGYVDGVFWERNTLGDQPKQIKKSFNSIQGQLFK